MKISGKITWMEEKAGPIQQLKLAQGSRSLNVSRSK